MSVPGWALTLPWAAIREKSEVYGLDPNLVAAIIQCESGGGTFKTRFEPAWKNFLSPRDWAGNLSVTEETETVHQQMSWGLMQVMGAVARQHGFEGDLPALCQPELGVEYGCRHLHWLKPRCHTEPDLICAYNHGHPAVLSSGTYVNQHYVDTVSGFLKELRSIS